MILDFGDSRREVLGGLGFKSDLSVVEGQVVALGVLRVFDALDCGRVS